MATGSALFSIRRFRAQRGTALTDFLPARNGLMRVLGYLAGKWPHSLALQPGGTTRAITATEKVRLATVLREFRVSHNHMAIVIDEYAGVSGLITIEDVLEQIVGDIEDEYDFDEAEDNIRPDQLGRFRVKAHTSIEDFDAHFGTQFAGHDYNTVSGLILNELGRVPRRKEAVRIGDLNFMVLRADRRRLYTLLVTREPAPDAAL